MGRHEESFGHDFERARTLGETNEKYIAGMRQWCKHFSVEMTSSGLYAEMSGLPIGGHEISCPYSERGGMSANLEWMCSSFLINECDDCQHHAPNGDDSWGKEIITKHKDREQVKKEEAAKRKDEIIRLRSELRLQSQSIGEKAHPESRKIVEFLESMFSESHEIRQDAVDKLVQAAQVGADLFSRQVVDILILQMSNQDYDEPAISVCAELAERRGDLGKELRDAALDVIRNGNLQHRAATIVARLGSSVQYPLSTDCIERLLLTQHHDIPIGGWGESKPDYSDSTNLLAHSYDANADSVLDIVRKHLQSDNDYVRKQLCSALYQIQQIRPEIALSILTELLKSLELYEENDITYGNASGRIVHVFQSAFRHAPRQVDRFFADHMERERTAVQEDIVRVYRDQFFDRDVEVGKRRDSKHTDNVSEAEKIAISRLFDWMKTEQLEPEIRHEVVKALELACTYATGEMVKEFDTLLGYYALLCERDDPPPNTPSIVLPGDIEDPALAHMKELSRRQHWGFLKQSVVKCLEELCKAKPREVFDLVHGCLVEPNSQIGEDFRGAAIALLGELGSHFDLQQRALPILMRELMNYESAWARAKAIYATIEMFYSQPPTDVVDTILIHMQDRKVVVHKAAVRAIDSRPSWFSEMQAFEALKWLTAHANAYLSDPYELEHICEAAMALASRHDGLKRYALALVESVFPAKERHLNKKIAIELRRIIGPQNELAPRVAIHLATFIAMHGRDRYNTYEFSDRDRIFKWLFELPCATIALISDQLLTQATKLAKRDFWESWHFASLFANSGLYSHERRVLEVIRDSYPPEPKFDEQREVVTALIALVSFNEHLKLGDEPKAINLLYESKEGLSQ